MQKVVNYGRGVVRYAVKGQYPERFLNICAAHNVAFWQVTRVDAATLHVSAHFSVRRKLVKLAEQAGFTVERLGQVGAPYLWRTLKSRLGLIIGCGLFVALVFTMSRFVWDIEVLGNEKVPTEQILLHLQELGVGIGTPVSRIHSQTIKDAMLLQIDELSWLAINVKGSRATVEVRERVIGEPRIDESVSCHLVAAKSGVIVSMNVRVGQQKKTVGSTVTAGEIIASGAIESTNGTIRMVHAHGEVYARTWYELQGCMALTATGKRYTGETKTTYGVKLGDTLTGLSLGSQPKNGTYDKRRTESRLTLPPGVAFPLATVREEYWMYVPQPYTISREVAQAALEKSLTAQLAQRSDRAEVVSMSIEYRTENGVLYGTLTAECREQIAVEQEFDPLTIPQPTPTPAP